MFNRQVKNRVRTSQPSKSKYLKARKYDNSYMVIKFRNALDNVKNIHLKFSFDRHCMEIERVVLGDTNVHIVMAIFQSLVS